MIIPIEKLCAQLGLDEKKARRWIDDFGHGGEILHSKRKTGK